MRAPTPVPVVSMAVAASVLAAMALVSLRWRKARSARVVATSERAALPRGPLVQGRRLQLGRTEKEYVRLAFEHVNAVKIFYSIAVAFGPEGPVGRESVVRACKALQVVHPLLRCVLVKGDDGYEFMETNVDIPVLERHHSTSREVFETEAETAPLELGKSPHKVWLIINEARSEFEIVLDAQHFSIDGSSLVHVVHRLLDFSLRGVPDALEHGPWPQPQCHALDVTSRHWPIARRLSAWAYALRQMVVPMARTSTAVPNNGCRSTARNRSMHVHCPLTVHETQALLKSLKDKKLTVTTAVTAAFADALAEELHASEAPTLKLCVVVDSRGLCAPPVDPMDLSIHVTSAPLFLAGPALFAPRGSVVALAAALKAHLAASMERLLDFAVVWAHRAAALQPAHARWGVQMPSLVVSSWSSKPPVASQYAEYAVKGGLLFQNVAHAGWLALSVYTPVQGGPLVVSVLAPVPRFAAEFVDRVAAGGARRVRALLPAAAAGE